MEKFYCFLNGNIAFLFTRPFFDCSLHFSKDQLRVWISKNGQIPESEFLDTISVSYQNQNYLSKCTNNHMNFGAKVKTRVTVAQSSFRSKAKMTNFAPNILPTFYWFSDTFLCTLQHIKNLAHRFFVSARYRTFSLAAWSKMKNFDPNHKSKIIHFS